MASKFQKSMRTLLRVSQLAAVSVTLLAAGAVTAQSAFPSRPVNLVVPFPPGGAADQPARLLAQALSHVWKQPVVVITRAGAGGGIGMAQVAAAPPDGHTIIATNPALLILPEADKLFGRASTFDRASFVPIALMVADPLIIVRIWPPTSTRVFWRSTWSLQVDSQSLGKLRKSKIRLEG